MRKKRRRGAEKEEEKGISVSTDFTSYRIAGGVVVIDRIFRYFTVIYATPLEPQHKALRGKPLTERVGINPILPVSNKL